MDSSTLWLVVGGVISLVLTVRWVGAGHRYFTGVSTLKGILFDITIFAIGVPFYTQVVKPTVLRLLM